jgi:hypothetical protein
MKWVEAVKIWNHTKREVNTAHGWFVPKAGTKEYDEVRDIMKMEKTKEHEEILSKKSERTVKKAERKAMIARGEKPKRMRKEKKEVMTEEKKEEIKKEYKGRNETRMSKALEQLRAFEKQIQESNMEKEKKAKALERVAKARADIESSVAPIREAKAKGNFRGQIIQKQRSKFVKLLDDIEFFLFDSNSPLRNKEVLREFGKDMTKKKAINDKFRIFLNLDKVTKDKVILERKEKLMERKASDPKAKMPPVVDVESEDFLKRSVKDVFDEEAPKVDSEEKKDVVEKIEEMKKDIKIDEKSDSESDEENSIEEMEKKLDKMKKNLGEWEKDAEARGVKKEVAQLKRNIKKLETEIKKRKGSSKIVSKKIYEKMPEEKKEMDMMKSDLPPPSTENKLEKSKKESSPEDEIEMLIKSDDDGKKEDISKKIIRGSEVADKYKQLSKKQRIQRRDQVLLFKEFMKASNVSKYDEVLSHMYDILKDSNIVVDKQWESMKVE